MHRVIPVTWQLRGEVNSYGFTLEGEGTADLEHGATTLRLSADPGFPDGFDPALSHMICNAPCAGYVAVPHVAVGLRDAVQQELFVRPRRQVEITDASGEQIVRLEALTTMTVSADAISVTSYMTGFSRLPAGVVRTYGEETLVPGGPCQATGVTRYHVELADGATLEGMTVVPYRYDRKDVRVSPAVRAIVDHACERVSATEVVLTGVGEWRDMPLLTVSEPGA